MRHSLIQAGKALLNGSHRARAVVSETSSLPWLTALPSRMSEAAPRQEQLMQVLSSLPWQQQRPFASGTGSSSSSSDSSTSSTDSDSGGDDTRSVTGFERFQEWAAKEGAKNPNLKDLVRQLGDEADGKGDVLNMSPAFQGVIDDFFNAVSSTTDQLSDTASAHKDEKLQELTKKLEDLTDGYKRTLAEMENVRRRAEKQQALTKDFAIQGFAKSLLDVADNLERAAEAVPESAVQEAAQDPDKLKALLESLLQGVKMTQGTLHQALRMNGVEQFDPMGQPFNPELHNALFKVPDPDKEPGHVAVVVKRGYKLKDRVLRAAEVGVTPVA